jgi:hypothetical protein
VKRGVATPAPWTPVAERSPLGSAKTWNVPTPSTTSTRSALGAKSTSMARPTWVSSTVRVAGTQCGAIEPSRRGAASGAAAASGGLASAALASATPASGVVRSTVSAAHAEAKASTSVSIDLSRRRIRGP